MSTHQSISGRQGRASLKRTNIGSSSSVQALMVKIDWTSSKVVRIEARKDFTLQAHTVQVKKGDYRVLAPAPVNVQAGMVLYFVASDEFEGWYYLLQYSESRSAFTCTCPKSAKFHQACDHQMHATVYVGHRYARRVETERAVDQDLQHHLEDDLHMATLERQYENICSESCDDGVPPMPPEILALYISEPVTMDGPPRAADVWQNVEDLEESSIA